MQCDVCGKKKATVHLTEIVDEQMTEMHLCESCAREKSVQMEQQFGLADLLAGLADFGQQVKDIEKIKIKCSNCALTYEDFRKFGRLGCGECYASFREHLATLLKKIHGSNRHLGKLPVKYQVLSTRPDFDPLEELKQQLKQAIQGENFEKAAELRDKIHELEKRKAHPHEAG
jgi:protein arginine kinase activator